MFNRFSNTSSLSTPPVSTNSFFGSQAQQQPQTQQANSSIPQSTSPFNPFGASGTGVSSSSTAMATPSTPYAITNEIENGITVKLLSITAMPAYRHLSQDEIRVDDYSKGRKGPASFPGSQTGAFSQPFSSASGLTGVSSSTGGFPYSSTGGFSGFNTATNTATPTSTGFGSFSQQTTPATSTSAPSSGFGGFGSNAFGSSSTSGFGTSTSTGTGTGAFGSTNTSNTRTFGSFGGAATQPSTTTTPSSVTTGFGGFGSSSNIGTNSFAPSTPGMFGGFGQSQPQMTQATQPQMSQVTQPFGQPASSTMFGAKPSTSIFGSTPTTTSSSTPTFGSSAFGTFFNAQPQAQQAGFSTTGFGQVQQPQSQQSTFGSSTGMFGSTPSTTGGGIFGSTSSSTPASSTPFTSTSSGMFGQATQQQPSIFGSTPATPATTSTNSASNLFRPTTTPASTFGSSTMFGASSGLANTSTVPGTVPATGTGMTGMFNRPSTLGAGTTTNTTAFTLPSTSKSGFSFQPLGTTTTGYSAGQPQSQGQGQATPLYQSALPLVEPASAGSLSLFPPLPSIFTKPAVTVTTNTSTEIPQQNPVKFTPRTSFRIKPRESYNLTTPIPINFGTGPLSGSSTTATSATNGAATNLVPRKMMNGSIPNIKKLVVPDFNNIHEQPSTPQGSKDKDSSRDLYTPYTSATSSTLTPYTSNLTPSTSSSILTDSMQFGQQYTFPPLKILKTTDRRSIKNFVIGQKGVGEVRFLVPVDLSEIDPEQLFGHYIEFSDCEAVMYPDPSIPKPEPGHGLNLPAQVRLERVWTMSKGSRDPIVDPQSEKVIHFIQKLKETEGTNFISYEPSTGTWTFTVDNF